VGTYLNSDIKKIDGVTLSPLKIIKVGGGDVFRAIKKDDSGYCGFGEAYFSTVHPGVIKAWKRHREMSLNLVVPSGRVRFVIYDDRQSSKSYGSFGEIILSIDNYYRLTLPPMLWVGFQGLSEHTSILLNIANIPHSESEADRKELNEINYDWEFDI
jgi:dTDP-4-dehydrorhamnose 3,5-epimerase